MGRPTKLDPDRQKRIVDAIRTGNYFDTAVALAGISRATAYGWLTRGEAERDRRAAGLTNAQRREKQLPLPTAEQSYLDFSDAVMAARAELEAVMVASVLRSARGGVVTRQAKRTYKDGSVEEETTTTGPDGRVAMEFLSRAFPSNWARRAAVDVELTVPGTGGEGGGGGVAQGGPEVALARRFAEWAEQRALEEEPIDAEVVDDEGGQRELEAG